ncbi:MAG: hypothetical protein AAGA60_04085 [Cyanobacteria bacterium P01_E01_bin.42]
MDRVQCDRDKQNNSENSKDEFFAPERSPSATPQQTSDISSVLRQTEATPRRKSQYTGQQLLASPALPVKPSPLPLQAKLEIGEVGARYEKEADRVANEVVQRLHTPQLHPAHKPPSLQEGQKPEFEVQRHPQQTNILKSGVK